MNYRQKLNNLIENLAKEKNMKLEIRMILLKN